MADDIFRVDLYPHNWLTGTSIMTPEQRGVYVQIVMLIYCHRGPIENDPAWIGRNSNCSSRKARAVIDELLQMEKLHITDRGFITNSRSENVLKEVRKRSEHGANMQRIKAEKEAEAKKNKEMGPAAQQVQETVSVSETVLPNGNKGAPPSSPEMQMVFENLWNLYPAMGKDGATGTAYKGSKQNARVKFETLYRNTKEAERETFVRNIAAGCVRYRGHLERSGYPSKHLVTWLNGRGWEDEYDSTGPVASGPAGGPKGGRGDNPADAMHIALQDQTRRH